MERKRSRSTEKLFANEPNIQDIDVPGFRVNARDWFLTYPRLDKTKEQVLDVLKFKIPLQAAVICRELHKDGTPHIHAYVQLRKRFDCKNVNFWDIFEQHGNYQAARSLEHVVQYIKKDSDFIEYGEINWIEKAASKFGHRKYIGEQLINGGDLVNVVKENPALIFGFCKLKQDVELFRAMNVLSKPRCEGFIPNTFGRLLPVLAGKLRHYWFWSAGANKGKTTFLKSVASTYPCLWYSWQESFQNYVPQAQFILLDEYSQAHLTIMQLNMMCDSTYQYPVKGTSSYQTPDCILLVCGNRDPLTIYQEHHHSLIKARFEIFEL